MRRVVCAATVWLVMASGAAGQVKPEPVPVAPGSAPATPPPAPKPDEVNLTPLLVKGRERGGFPAVGVAIVRPDGRVQHGVLGARRAGVPDVVRLDDRWHLGSCGKAMTATLIAMLVEKGKLRWETTLAEAFPGMGERMTAGFRGVTLEQLLHGRSGVPAQFPPELWDRVKAFKGTEVEGRRMIVEAVLAGPHQPAEEFVYSNIAWVIAGAMAETLAGEPFEAMLRSMLLEPLGMTTAGFGAPGRRVGAGGVTGSLDAPRGHHASGISQEPGPDADNPPALSPAGTLHASLEDWGKFIAMQLRGLTGRPSMLRPESWAKIMNPPPGQHAAMGWLVQSRGWADGPALTHDGSNTMWFSVAWMAPRKEFAVLVTTNIGGGNVALTSNQLAWDVIQEHLRVTEGREGTGSGR